MKVLIVGNRPLNEDITDISEGKIIIAADGGADRLLEHEIKPDWVINCGAYTLVDEAEKNKKKHSK